MINHNYCIAARAVMGENFCPKFTLEALNSTLLKALHAARPVRNSFVTASFVRVSSTVPVKIKQNVFAYMLYQKNVNVIKLEILALFKIKR